MSSSFLSKNIKIKIHRTINLPVVMYGCKTWSLTLREERRLTVFENRVLRKIFAPKRDEVTGEWGKLRNEELNDLYSSPNFLGDHIERNGMDRACSTYGGVYRVLVGKSERKRPLGRPRRTWEDNIKMYLQELVFGGMNWIDLAQYRDSWRALVNAVMNLRAP